MNAHAKTDGRSEVRILLVDDQPEVRCGLRMILQLEAGAVVIGEAGTATEALMLAEALKPHLVIMDVEMPGIDGIAATERLLGMWPECLIIILTIHNRPDIKARAFAAGAWAFVEKGRPEDMRTAFRRAQSVLF